MVMETQSCITVFLWIVMTAAAAGLKCWKCIAHDCEIDPSENNKAATQSCREGQACMKVRYRMFDNYTHFDSIIRTCSSDQCDSTTMDQFMTCVKEPKKYMISGCVLKSCCRDRDLCNSGVKLLTSRYLWIISLNMHSIIAYNLYA